MVRLRFALEGFLDLRGYWDEALRTGELAVKAARASQSDIDIAGLSHNLAVMYQGRGELQEARRLYSGIAITLHQLGRLAEDQGELGEARRLYDESLRIKQRLGNQSGIASTLHQLGRLAEEEDDRAEAARLLREALSIFERLKSPYAEIARDSLARVEVEGE